MCVMKHLAQGDTAGACYDWEAVCPFLQIACLCGHGDLGPAKFRKPLQVDASYEGTRTILLSDPRLTAPQLQPEPEMFIFN